MQADVHDTAVGYVCTLGLVAALPAGIPGLHLSCVRVQWLLDHLTAPHIRMTPTPCEVVGMTNLLQHPSMYMNVRISFRVDELLLARYVQQVTPISFRLAVTKHTTAVKSIV